MERQTVKSWGKHVARLYVEMLDGYFEFLGDDGFHEAAPRIGFVRRGATAEASCLCGRARRAICESAALVPTSAMIPVLENTLFRARGGGEEERLDAKEGGHLLALIRDPASPAAVEDAPASASPRDCREGDAPRALARRAEGAKAPRT